MALEKEQISYENYRNKVYSELKLFRDKCLSLHLTDSSDIVLFNVYYTNLEKSLSTTKATPSKHNNDLKKVCPYHPKVKLYTADTHYFCPVEECLYSEDKPILKS